MKNEKEKQWLSDIITLTDIKSWSNETPVVIDAPTGSGKTTFIIENLGNYARNENKTILIITSRTASRERIKADVKAAGMQDVIMVRSYQQIAKDARDGKEQHLEMYSYIVCDEFHFFLSDAPFNRFTDFAFFEIMAARQAVRVFMSATGRETERYIRLYSKTQPVRYKIKIDWAEAIESIEFFDRYSHIDELIDGIIEKGEKAIVFINSLEKALEIHGRHKKESVFVCSLSNKDYRQYMDRDKAKKIIQDERFDENILITTTALDVGINIKDDAVKHIILDIKDTDSLIQCIGRKRRKDGEKVNLYIKNQNSSILGGIKSEAIRLLQEADFFIEHGTEQYLRNYCTEEGLLSKICYLAYDCTIKMNQFYYYKLQVDIATIDEIKQLGGWVDFWLRVFNIDEYRYENKTENVSLKKFLQQQAGQVMPTPQDREDLITKIGLKRNGRLVRGINALNGYLRDIGAGYEIQKAPGIYEIEGIKKQCRSAWILRTLKKGETL